MSSQNTLGRDAGAVDEEKSMEKIIKIHLITDEEIQAAINKLRKGASDNNGVRAEDVKNCDVATKEKIKGSSTKC